MLDSHYAPQIRLLEIMSMWYGVIHTTGNDDIFFKRSTDGGANFIDHQLI